MATTQYRTLRGLLVVSALLSLVACSGMSPTAPSVREAESRAAVNFSGQFSGTFTVESCADSLDGRFCTGVGFAPGHSVLLGLTLNQTQTAVTGTLLLGGYGGPFQGTVTESGLAGSSTLDVIQVAGETAHTSVTAWNSSLTGNAMTGTFTVTTVATEANGFNWSLVMHASVVQLSR